MSESRKLTLEEAFVVTRLLDKRYWDDVGQAITMGGTKGFKLFEKVCKSAGIPKNMISPTWKGLMAYEKEAADVGTIDW